jgi:hypothetical protein
MSAARQLEIMRRKRACKGKAGHLSLGSAEAHIRAMRKAGIWNGHVAYRCDFCRKWHVGRRAKGVA